MHTKLKLSVLLGAIVASQAHAGATIPIGEDKSVTVGFGARGSYSSVEDGAPNSTSVR